MIVHECCLFPKPWQYTQHTWCSADRVRFLRAMGKPNIIEVRPWPEARGMLPLQVGSQVGEHPRTPNQRGVSHAAGFTAAELPRSVRVICCFASYTQEHCGNLSCLFVIPRIHCPRDNSTLYSAIWLINHCQSSLSAPIVPALVCKVKFYYQIPLF